jgi:hypothetical protein
LSGDDDVDADDLFKVMVAVQHSLFTFGVRKCKSVGCCQEEE